MFLNRFPVSFLRNFAFEVRSGVGVRAPHGRLASRLSWIRDVIRYSVQISLTFNVHVGHLGQTHDQHSLAIHKGLPVSLPWISLASARALHTRTRHLFRLLALANSTGCVFSANCSTTAADSLSLSPKPPGPLRTTC